MKRIWRMCCSEKVKNFVGWLLTFPKRCLSICLICLQQGVKAAGSYRERDMLLMAMITNISACLPEVRVLYDQVYYSPHLYYMVIARGRRKGGGVSGRLVARRDSPLL